ncbi:FlgB family protein [Sulfitobacter sp. F26169L]|uniref:FlgB family protein n=1 Tax=Sulfitobacter sp. F26169L TaxID=2996015 RepID=UPI0022609C75|nr:FlgB family protein [Sulfitobacter sp. F26169L]MCX7565789.1 FlgB family protein [Sulfitobacter sp. F26169L]
MARHAGQSQALISQNVANADTPGYVGKEMPAFAELYAPNEMAGIQRATRQGHLHGSVSVQSMTPTDMRNGDNPNGNTVSLETEMMKAAEVKSHHDRALAIYKSALDVLRVSVRTR